MGSRDTRQQGVRNWILRKWHPNARRKRPGMLTRAHGLTLLLGVVHWLLGYVARLDFGCVLGALLILGLLLAASFTGYALIVFRHVPFLSGELVQVPGLAGSLSGFLACFLPSSASFPSPVTSAISCFVFPATLSEVLVMHGNA